MMYALSASCVLFQSTPLREGRLKAHYASLYQSMFQSTPLREGRRNQVYDIGKMELFQSTPLREGRPVYLVITQN